MTVRRTLSATPRGEREFIRRLARGCNFRKVEWRSPEEKRPRMRTMSRIHSQ